MLVGRCAGLEVEVLVFFWKWALVEEPFSAEQR